MTSKNWTIGFDADDTLWHNERFFKLTQDRFADLLADCTEAGHLQERLIAAERRNMERYGFGIKGFVLSMIETAIEVTDSQVPASVIAELIAAGQEMLAHPIDLMPDAEEALRELGDSARIILVTKGDLLDQERKLAQSGLGAFFDHVEIVSDKTTATYARIFGQDAGRAMMVGNSLKSDVIPAIEAGGWGVHVPHELTWAYEHADAPEDHPRFHSIERLAALPELIRSLA